MKDALEQRGSIARDILKADGVPCLSPYPQHPVKLFLRPAASAMGL